MTSPLPDRGSTTAVTVVDPDDAVAKVLVEHVRPIDADARYVDSFDTVTVDPDPAARNVIVAGPSLDPLVAVADLEDLLERRPNCGAVMVVYELSTNLLRQALRAGVDDVVVVESDDNELRDAITRAADRVTVRLPEVVVPAAATPDHGADRMGRVLSVFCSKGGAGKSVIATNLAIALARRSQRPVVLVDADVQFGDIALMLQLQPVHTIAEAAEAGDRLDSVLLDSLLLHHQPSGISVLAAPTEPGTADVITRLDMDRILALLKERFAYVVVDNMTTFGEVTLAALEDADDILMVAGLDVMSLKSSRVGLQTMRILGVPLGKITFVLNRANTKVGLSIADAERSLELKVDAALPSELAVAESVNTGTPVVLGSPRSRFARSIEALAERLVAAPAEPDAKAR